MAIRNDNNFENFYPAYDSSLPDAFSDAKYCEQMGSESEAYDKLNNMIGLSSIKTQIMGIVKRIEIENYLKSRGLQTTEFVKNFIFTGNPGVAKTTVAKLLSYMLYDKGIISKGGMISAGRSSVIGE